MGAGMGVIMNKKMAGEESGRTDGRKAYIKKKYDFRQKDMQKRNK